MIFSSIPHATSSAEHTPTAEARHSTARHHPGSSTHTGKQVCFSWRVRFYCCFAFLPTPEIWTMLAGRETCFSLQEGGASPGCCPPASVNPSAWAAPKWWAFSSPPHSSFLHTYASTSTWLAKEQTALICLKINQRDKLAGCLCGHMSSCHHKGR